MTKLDETIGNLVKDGNSKVSASTPLSLFLKWLVVTTVSTGIIVAFMTPRPDLHQQLASTVYLGEIISLALIILSTSVVAVWLCYPDIRQKPMVLSLPLLPVAAFTALSFYRILHPEMTLIPPPEQVKGMDCALCVTSFALVPGFWMFRLIRLHATVLPWLAGAMSFIASASIGLLALKLVEPNDSILHLLTWHVSPMVLLAIMGAALGKKYLSW